MASSASAGSSPNANEDTGVKRTALSPMMNAIVVVADPAPSPVKRRLPSSKCGVAPSVAAAATTEEEGRRMTRKPATTVLPPPSTKRPPLPARRRTGPASSSPAVAVGGARPAYLPKAKADSDTTTDQEATSRRLISNNSILLDALSDELSKIVTEAALAADSPLQEALISASVARNTREFSEICAASSKVTNPIQTVNLFLDIYESSLQWKAVADGFDGTSLEKSASKMHTWFMAFVDKAVEDENNVASLGKHTTMLPSQFEKMSYKLDQVAKAAEDDRVVMEEMEGLKRKIYDFVRH